MKRIAILSDIHGNVPALEAVVADMQKRNVDQVINLGDHLSGPLWPKETVQFLMKQEWIQILGNHDRQLLADDPTHLGASDQYAYPLLDEDECDWFRSLEPVLTLPDEILLCHGSPSDEKMYLLETIENGRNRLSTPSEIKKRLEGATCSVLLCGHTHIPRVVRVEDMLIVNPGSVGLPAYDDVLPVPHVMETGSPHARYALMEKCGDDWNAEIIAITYDYQKAAEQAIKNNRHDWEVGLLTGFMER